MSRFQHLGTVLDPNASFPGATSIRWQAGLVHVAEGDILEIHWGVAGTQFDKGRKTTGAVHRIEVTDKTGPFGRYKEGVIIFAPCWHEEVMDSVVGDETLMLIPSIVQVDFPYGFSLRTDDTGDEAWQLVIVGHDCAKHPDVSCESQWLQKATPYLKAGAVPQE